MWKKSVSLEAINKMSENTLMSRLEMEVTEVGADFLKGTMPVSQLTHQPMGFLHGGASAALAESLGSIAGNLAAPEGFYCVGVEINASHVQGKQTGQVTGIATPVRVGNSLQVWQIHIEDEQGQLICSSRLTLAVRKMGG